MQTDDATGNEREPVEHFEPLPAGLAATFYRLATPHQRDGLYYRRVLTEHRCHRVLELGCGTGRISDYLTRSGFAVVGIDISPAMLQDGRNQRLAPVAQMDMCRLGFHSRFDAAIIAWNTLNLLGRKAAIRSCLEEVRTVLAPGGLLLLHLFVPDQNLIDHPGQRFFQFSLFDLPAGGRLIKETLRSYDPSAHSLLLEERYKLRFLPNGRANENYRHDLHLAAFPADTWLSLLHTTGFTVHHRQASFEEQSTTHTQPSILLIIAQCAT
ncbi:class I SAM-dependent methyltransferase [Desulfofustis limnaeus]|uniref:Methyltransferase n=1 Tax=Desulfofustis limnaeus TaxID=2740163 RepID=A0ABN6M5T9_9BACT|nr:class I SAM-dependent methyltransferase [Desulfofustis limnaeus]BDD87580.1 methyltransferase [Desulfofustis limnaeus]